MEALSEAHSIPTITAPIWTSTRMWDGSDMIHPALIVTDVAENAATDKAKSNTIVLELDLIRQPT
jgi:hypothetical protein